MLAQVMEAEVASFIDNHTDQVDENGDRKVVRNGHKPTRELTTGISTGDGPYLLSPISYRFQNAPILCSLARL